MDYVIVKPEYSNDMIDFVKNHGRIAASELEPDTPDDIPTIVEKVWERGPIEAALAKSDARRSVTLDWLAAPPSHDVDEDSLELDKTPRVQMQKATPAPIASASAPIVKASGMTRAQKLGIVKTAVREVNGEKQQRGFNAAGELVDFRILLPETPDTED